MATEVRYTVQFCQGGYDITGQLYAEQDADVVRFWEGDFVLLEMTRSEHGPGWVATGGDSAGWVDLGELPFSTPFNALRALLPADTYTLIESE